MKINWGTGIVLALIGFIGFILFFVIRMSTDDRANHDLVTEEYYKAELEYQKEIDAANNASDISAQFKFKRTAEGLLITLPEKIKNQDTKGTVSLYRPSNKHLDFNLPISLSNTHLLIPNERLLDGRWDIKIFWEENGNMFLHKKSITY